MMETFLFYVISRFLNWRNYAFVGYQLLFLLITQKFPHGPSYRLIFTTRPERVAAQMNAGLSIYCRFNNNPFNRDIKNSWRFAHMISISKVSPFY